MDEAKWCAVRGFQPDLTPFQVQCFTDPESCIGDQQGDVFQGLRRHFQIQLSLRMA
jgi:hypothetical protein